MRKLYPGGGGGITPGGGRGKETGGGGIVGGELDGDGLIKPNYWAEACDWALSTAGFDAGLSDG